MYPRCPLLRTEQLGRFEPGASRCISTLVGLRRPPYSLYHVGTVLYNVSKSFSRPHKARGMYLYTRARSGFGRVARSVERGGVELALQLNRRLALRRIGHVGHVVHGGLVLVGWFEVEELARMITGWRGGAS